MVELNGACSNPRFRDETLPRLRQISGKATSRRRKPVTKVLKPRTGLVQETVKHVLLSAGKPLRVKEIHKRCEEVLGTPVNYSTVKDCLREKRRAQPLFDRVAHGTYQAHIELISYEMVRQRRRHPGR